MCGLQMGLQCPGPMLSSDELMMSELGAQMIPLPFEPDPGPRKPPPSPPG